jgi:universal stress protein A
MKATPASLNRTPAKPTARKKGRRAAAPEPAVEATELEVTRILVPIDFSPPSRKALSHALGLARQFGAEVTLAHVMEPVIYPNDWVYPIALTIFVETRKTLLERLKALTSDPRTSARAVVRTGRAWREIVDLAKERSFDLIVIATHGYTGVKRALLGSVTEKVVQHAPCAVLTLRAGKGSL